jgi:hypothetical protein
LSMIEMIEMIEMHTHAHTYNTHNTHTHTHTHTRTHTHTHTGRGKREREREREMAKPVYGTACELEFKPTSKPHVVCAHAHTYTQARGSHGDGWERPNGAFRSFRGVYIRLVGDVFTSRSSVACILNM